MWSQMVKCSISGKASHCISLNRILMLLWATGRQILFRELELFLAPFPVSCTDFIWLFPLPFSVHNYITSVHYPLCHNIFFFSISFFGISAYVIVIVERDRKGRGETRDDMQLRDWANLNPGHMVPGSSVSQHLYLYFSVCTVYWDPCLKLIAMSKKKRQLHPSTLPWWFESRYR